MLQRNPRMEQFRRWTEQFCETGDVEQDNNHLPFVLKYFGEDGMRTWMASQSFFGPPAVSTYVAAAEENWVDRFRGLAGSERPPQFRVAPQRRVLYTHQKECIKAAEMLTENGENFFEKILSEELKRKKPQIKRAVARTIHVPFLGVYPMLVYADMLEVAEQIPTLDWTEFPYFLPAVSDAAGWLLYGKRKSKVPHETIMELLVDLDKEWNDIRRPPFFNRPMGVMGWESAVCRHYHWLITYRHGDHIRQHSDGVRAMSPLWQDCEAARNYERDYLAFTEKLAVKAEEYAKEDDRVLAEGGRITFSKEEK